MNLDSAGTTSKAATNRATGSPAETTRFDDDFRRRLAALALVAKKTSLGGGPGRRRGRRVGAGIDFADHRSYAPGDDVRALDWNLYARVGRPFIRLREEDEDLTLSVMLDGSASMALGTPPKWDLAVRLGAALAYIGLAALDRVAVSVVGAGVRDLIGPLHGKAGATRVLASLARARPAGQTDLAASARGLVAGGAGGRRGLVVVISDGFDGAGLRPALDQLRAARRQVVVIQITAPDEATAALPEGDVTVEDAETGERTELTVTAAMQRAYVARYQTLLRDVAALCRQRGVPCFQLSSAMAFEDAVLRILREGGVLA